MLGLTSGVRILLSAQPIDMRNSIDGLCAIVRNEWKENLFAGHLFVFVSKRGDRVKILSWEHGGFVVTYKRLEQGRFRLPEFHEGALGAQIDSTQLAMLLDGIDVSRVRRPKKWAPLDVEGSRQMPRNLIDPTRWQVSERRTTVFGDKRPMASVRNCQQRPSDLARSKHSSKSFSGIDSGGAPKRCPPSLSHYDEKQVAKKR